MFLLRTRNDFAMLFVRLALGLSMLPHGLSKLGIWDDASTGLFDYAGERADMLATLVGGEPWMGWLAIVAEVVGSVVLIFGFFGRFCALAIAGVMGVAAWKVSGLDAMTTDAWLNWWRSDPSGSYHLLALGAALAILIRGSGALSIDLALSSRGPRLD